jgi:osmoprotectant transport system permease protein
MNAMWQYLRDNHAEIKAWTLTTLWLSLLPLAIALVLALPAGWLATRRRWAYDTIVGLSGTLYTIPSLVLFLVLPELLGTKILSAINVAIALTIYSFALLVRTTADALNSVPKDLLAAATAVGHSGFQRLLVVELPVATPVIAAGLRVAAVSNVSLISVASIIGVTQLGQLFTLGESTESVAPIVLGLILFVLLALIYDGVIVAVARIFTPWRKAANG